MLIEKIEKFSDKTIYDLSCSETVLSAANEYYNLNLDQKSLHMMAPFSGGMMIEESCGALTASISVLGILFTDQYAHNSELLKLLVNEFFENFYQEMNSFNCKNLKDNYRTEENGCIDVIRTAAIVLDAIVTREKENIILSEMD